MVVCEKVYVEVGTMELYKKKGVNRPEYQGSLPEGNNGLGLLLLGVTGDHINSHTNRSHGCG